MEEGEASFLVPDKPVWSPEHRERNFLLTDHPLEEGSTLYFLTSVEDHPDTSEPFPLFKSTNPFDPKKLNSSNNSRNTERPVAGCARGLKSYTLGKGMKRDKCWKCYDTAAIWQVIIFVTGFTHIKFLPGSCGTPDHYQMNSIKL